MTLFHCASVISSKRASLWSPALLTRISTVPKCSMTRRNMSETSDSADTSARTVSERLPERAICSATSTALSSPSR